MECHCNDFNIIDGAKAKDYANSHLLKVEVRNWEIDYECPETGIHWLMDYPYSERQGGGPPRLRKLPLQEI
jgi:hypothetical protein